MISIYIFRKFNSYNSGSNLSDAMPRKGGNSSSTCPVKAKSKVRVVMSAPVIEDCEREVRRASHNQAEIKLKKKLTTKSCDRISPSSRMSSTAFRYRFSSNPRTVRERRMNLTILKDFNKNYEDDIFECVDQTEISSKILLDASASSSDTSSSPSLSRTTSPLILPNLTMTREETPLQYRAILERDKAEPLPSTSR